MKRLHYLLGLLAVVLLAWVFRPYLRTALAPVANPITHRKSVADRLAEFGGTARSRWKPFFDSAHTASPPAGVRLVALKTERVMQVYAIDQAGGTHWIRSLPIRAASGFPGPKLAEEDFQVPEGVYPVESLNPNSDFHVALRVGYPNAFDRARAAEEGRTHLGGDIMIHGNAVSIGCLAMGDEAAEDLFVLAADTGLAGVTVIIAPVDFRQGKSVPKQFKLPEWSDAFYAQIKLQLAGLPAEGSK